MKATRKTCPKCGSAAIDRRRYECGTFDEPPRLEGLMIRLGRRHVDPLCLLRAELSKQIDGLRLFAAAMNLIHQAEGGAK